MPSVHGTILRSRNPFTGSNAASLAAILITICSLLGGSRTATAQTQTAVEYYYSAWDFYFVTSFPAEIAALDGGAFGGAWKRTGQSFDVWTGPANGALPTCRFFSTAFAPKSAHFYTPYASECASLMAGQGWQFESIAFYLQLPDANGNCAPGTTILYRLYNNGLGGAPNHRFTTSTATFNQMQGAGWAFEGDGRTGAFACVPQSISLPPSSTLARQCAAPRPANAADPVTGSLYRDTQGSLTTEKSWIRSYVNETYLWYADVPPVDPAPYIIGATVPLVDPGSNVAGSMVLNDDQDVVNAYFNSQRSPLFTASGKPKDQFHFTYLTSDWVALATLGDAAGFGFQVALLAASPPRDVRVAYTQPGTTAAQNNLTRGARFLTVDGVDVATSADIATLNEALFSPVSGKQYTFEVLDEGSATARSIVMIAGVVTEIPVQNVGSLPAPNGSVGYMLFNDHIATAEGELISAMIQLKAAAISDLVLDIRYNGGGYLDIASELAYMIAGPAATSGRAFERSSFNDKNPFSLSVAQSTTPFHSTTQGFSTRSGVPLPQLGLPRVYVITSGDTCSASEAVINGLRGVGINVIQVGGTTCGKPYGFFPQDNCSTTYFTIQFQGVNDAGFGDYADGFIPGGTGTAANNLPGCEVADDFTRALGDPLEARLAAALQYRATGACPAVAKEPAADRVLVRSPLRENRWLRAPTRRYE
jgi:carboxyl-terminal processing protease